jgi:hypothetical protein
MLGRVVIFMAGGWLLMSAFAWPQSEASCANTCVAGALTIAYGLVSIFYAPARYLNTAHACLICLLSLSLDGMEGAASANNVMVAAVIFGASLWPVPRTEVTTSQGAMAWVTDASKASRTGRPTRPGGIG